MTKYCLIAAVLFVVIKTYAAGPTVESIAGAKVISLTSLGGSNKTAGVGSTLNAGDRIKTDSKTSTRVIYDDGSQLLIGRSSDLEIQPKEGETQWNHLHQGQARGIVTKPKSAAPAKGHAPYKFGVRTKTAVMGVRGTDFVAETNESGDATSFHTLDGKVDVAKDETTLISGKGISLIKDQFTEIQGGQPAAPRKFDRSQFLGQLQSKQPDFSQYLKTKPKTPAQLEKLRSLSPPQASVPPAATPALPTVPPAPTVAPPPVHVPPAPAAPSLPGGIKKRFGG